MEILDSVEKLRIYRKNAGHQSVGLVPTMGALHDGHASLIKKSTQQNAITIVSIFVNPTQFAPHEDFDQYPRSLQEDLQLCQKLGAGAVFTPAAKDMYPREDEVTLNPPKSMGNVLEGARRGGHFHGVLQVVLKLFCLTQPHFAYFGQKDAQQLLLIKRMVEDLFLNLEIVACPTQRDFDGLALSSRNVYLSREERSKALAIPRALQTIKELVAKGEGRTEILLAEAKKYLQEIELDYLEIVDHSLKPLQNLKEKDSLVLIAARVGRTRLIDNLWL